MRTRRKIASLGLTAAATAGLVLGTAPQSHASAAPYCDNYNPYCMHFYYNSGLSGSFTAFVGFDHYTLDGYKFLRDGAGKGQYVKNNAASASNLSDYDLNVYFNSNLSGACDSIPPYGTTNTGPNDRLVNTYNENASFGYGRYNGNCYKF
ncbi:hypothetical protein ACFVZW_20555 [Streptomyces sp. NPDC059567]|uniref:hypothetical protein n=1 Tax=Streptomyces sp. NPDC059567 TaxID=3346867 RepID=UPI0036C68DAE